MKKAKKTKKTKKILLLTWELYPLFVGGLGILAQDIVNELENQNVDVTVLMPMIPQTLSVKKTVNLEKSTKKFLKKRQSIPGLEFDLELFNKKGSKKAKTWPQLFLNNKGVEKITWNVYPNNTPSISRAFAFAVDEFINNSDVEYDAVIGMDWQTIPTKFLLKNNHPNLPFYFHMNSIEMDRSPNTKLHSATQRSIISLEEQGLSQADKVIVVSDVTKKSVIKFCGVAENNIVVANNDLTFFPIKEGYKELDKGKNILYVGRIFPQKGLEFLLDTAKKVVGIDPQVKFLIAGDGILIPSVIESISERELEKNVIVTGWIGGREKKQLYKSGDLFVMPSQSEPFGLTALEAIKSGVPVISSKDCGFLDVIPSTPTFDYYDTNQFAEMIFHYINDKEDKERLLEKQKNELSKHKWSEQIKKIVNLI